MNCGLIPLYSVYHTRKNFGKGKIGELGKLWAIRQIFLANIHRYTKNVFSICTDCSLFAPNFSSPIAFTCMVHQNFPHQNFPMYGNSWILGQRGQYHADTYMCIRNLQSTILILWEEFEALIVFEFCTCACPEHSIRENYCLDRMANQK